MMRLMNGALISILLLGGCADMGSDPPTATATAEPEPTWTLSVTVPNATPGQDVGTNGQHYGVYLGSTVTLHGTVTPATPPPGLFTCFRFALSEMDGRVMIPTGSTVTLRFESPTHAWFRPDRRGFYWVLFGFCDPETDYLVKTPVQPFLTSIQVVDFVVDF